MKQLLLFFLLSIPAFAQKSFLVKDSSTNEPIAYTSVFTENGTFKVNAEPDGSFTIPNEFLHEIFVFDAVGYEAKQQLLTDIVLLETKSEVLDEVVIVSSLGTKEIKVGSVKKSEQKTGFGAGSIENNWRFGRFFNYNKEIESHPFLKDVSFRLDARQKVATYAVKIYEADEQGFPAELLHDELIIGKIEKRKKISKIDLQSYNIMIPKNGIVVVFEWLTIESNYYEIEYYSEEDKKTKKTKGYNPIILASTTADKKQSLIKYHVVTKDKWENITQDFLLKHIEKGSYPLIMCELTLTN
ncbi:MAG: hypothetical protein RSD30_18440 [Flavobacterium sp.]